MKKIKCKATIIEMMTFRFTYVIEPIDWRHDWRLTGKDIFATQGQCRRAMRRTIERFADFLDVEEAESK